MDGVPGEGCFWLTSDEAVGWVFRRLGGFVVGSKFGGWMRETDHWFCGRAGAGVPLA